MGNAGVEPLSVHLIKPKDINHAASIVSFRFARQSKILAQRDNDLAKGMKCPMNAPTGPE